MMAEERVPYPGIRPVPLKGGYQVWIKTRWSRADYKAINAINVEKDEKGIDNPLQVELWGQEIMARIIVKWDLTNPRGEAIPFTRENLLETLADEDYGLIFDEIMKDRKALMAPVNDPNGSADSRERSEASRLTPATAQT